MGEQHELLPTQALRNLNEGHGHIFLRPDGYRARCGGHSMCSDCFADLEKLQASWNILSAPTVAVKPLPRSNQPQWELDWCFLDKLHKKACSYEDGMATHVAVEAIAMAVERRILSALSPQPPMSPQDAAKVLLEAIEQKHPAVEGCGYVHGMDTVSWLGAVAGGQGRE